MINRKAIVPSDGRRALRNKALWGRPDRMHAPSFALYLAR